MAEPSSTGAVPNPQEGPGKGRAFFERARTVAATGNYDYAIDMYIEGLNREPFNVAEHTALRDVSLTRKVKGGKAAGGILGPKLPYKGKSAKEAMLNAEYILAKDPGNIPSMLTIIRNAVELQLKDVVLWIGPTLLAANRTTKTPKLEIFLELSEMYDKMKEYSKASEALQQAMILKPTDLGLSSRAKDLSAKETLEKGNYEQSESFKGSIKDREQTKELMQEESLSKSDDYKIAQIELSRKEYEKNTKELQVITKYVNALRMMDDETHETVAIDVLNKAYKETGVYRHKMAIGEIRMKQFKRNMRFLVEALKGDPEDKETGEQLAEVRKERLAFEVGEFKERVEHFPTDMLFMYEYGVRLYEAGKYDEAIGMFQQAQNNPKHRVEALHFLGRSFLTQGMKHEAMETLKRAIESYELAETGDTKSKELHYWLARAYEENGRFGEAMNLYSTITQWDITYRDSRKRLSEMRAKAAAG